MTGSGFTPNGQVTLDNAFIYPDGQQESGPQVHETADAEGRLLRSGALNEIDVDHFTWRVTATDVTRAAQGAPESERIATTSFTASFFGIFVKAWNTDGPARGRPGHRITLDAGGFTGDIGSALYMHYLRRGRVVHTQRLGRIKGPCGTLTRKIREFAFRPVPAGTYKIRFSSHKVFDRRRDKIGYKAVVVRPKDAVPLRSR